MADWEKVETTPEDDEKAFEEIPAATGAEEASGDPEADANAGGASEKDTAAEKAARAAAKQEEKAARAAQKAEKAAARAEKKKQKLIAYGKKMREKEAEKGARFSKHGKRRGRFAFAAPLGVIMSLLAIFGAVSLVSDTVQMVRSLSDDSALREEVYYFLQPLMAYNPISDFDDVNAEDINELLQAAVWRITEAERIRMLREKDDNTIYELDGNGRLIVPAAEIEASYQYLYGADAVLHHRSLEDDDLEYSESKSQYYVPFNFISSLYQPVLDTIRHRGKNYYVRVAYVSINDLQIDEHGNTVDPTPDMASFEQIYVLQKPDSHFILTAVGEEG